MKIDPADILIRPATRDDFPALILLFAADGIGGHGDTTEPSAVPDYLSAFDWIAASTTSNLFVAEVGGRVVGTFQTVFGRSLSNRGGASLTVVAVQTRQDMRGRGIGAAMMRFAIGMGERLGAYQVRLTSHMARADAHRFYAGLGFDQSHAGFRMLIGQAAPG